MKNLKQSLIAIALVMALLLGACKQEAPMPTPVINSHQPTTVVVTEPTSEETAQTPGTSVESPTPVVPAKLQAQLVLWAQGSADANTAQAFERQLQAYAAQNALSFERREELRPSQLSEQTQLVVALTSLDEVQTMAEANARVQYLFIGDLQESPLSNLHVLSQAQALPEYQSFLAGLAAVLGTTEYRVGSITQSNTAAGAMARDGFLTGARYFCGLCRSRHTPLVVYPIQAEIESNANWQGALDSLLAQNVKTVFVQAELSSPELINALNAQGITLVGIEGQSGLEVAQNLIGVLSSGVVADISPIVERILAGESLGVIKIGMELTRIDENKLGVGRQILFNRFKEDLLNGEIKALPHGQ